MSKPLISIVLLTYSRPSELKRNIDGLTSIKYHRKEIIVVDNASNVPAADVIKSACVDIVRCDENLGVAGRNVGILRCTGDIIVTLDDDVFGFDDIAIEHLVRVFDELEDVAAINFKVVDDVTEGQMNWIHHRRIEEYGNCSFDTYEISEGAVAFRRSDLLKTSLYPDYYFISHEGPDLALQIIKMGGRIIYFPQIVVRHAHSSGGRVSWRRYYYDARNQIWLAIRHYPFFMALRKLFLGLSALFVYSVRDGYGRYFCKAVLHAIMSIRRPLKERSPIEGFALIRYKEIEKENAGFLYMIKKRLFAKEVKI
ncbi:glycosyltransferase family 2 protein [Marinobacter sp.]|uniref:glycosyltransferase family 2 protein n=1 Tax=Marinobacter sp. TaxID=50741 RepID=UPI0035C6D51C